MRERAIVSMTTPCSAIGLPKATRDFARAHIASSDAVVDPAGAQAALGDLEAAAFAQQQVRGGYPHVLELDLEMAVRRVVVAEHGKRPDQGHPGRIARH
jgi:hypothetical protein